MRYWKFATKQQALGTAFDDPNVDKEHVVDLDDDSPYPEVRSAVANTDNPDMPCSTFRTWVIGLVKSLY